MNEKKYTISDIAKEAGVSKAAVSYVLNDKGEKVSNKTKNKILQIANLFNYTPNFSARYLSKRNEKYVGILISNKINSFSNIEDFELIKKLKDALFGLGANVVLIEDSERYDNMRLAYDMVIGIDLNVDKIEIVCNATLSPLLLVDCIKEDKASFFYCIADNFSQAAALAQKRFKSENTCVIFNEYNSEIVNKEFYALPYKNIYAFENYEKLVKYIQDNIDCNFIVFGRFLGALIQDKVNSNQLAVICDRRSKCFNENVNVINMSLTKKVNKIVEICSIFFSNDKEKLPENHRIRIPADENI